MRTSSNVLLARMLARSRLRQWQLIQEISALGSVQRAAEAIGMSQPAATHALAELERLLGFSMFERHAKGARLTPAGEAVLPKVRTAMAAFAECAEVMSDLLSGSQGEVRVGAIEAAIGGLLGDAIARFTEIHPALVVKVVNQAPDSLLQSLSEGVIDLVVARRPAQLPAGTVFEALRSDRYIIVCSPRHPLAGRTNVTRDQLAQQLWLAAPKASIAQGDFQAFWIGTAPPRNLCWVESRALTLTFAMIEQRQALVMIPRNIVQPWLANGLLAEVPGSWGLSIEPVGVLFRTCVLDERGPVRDLLDVLRRFREAPPNSADV